MPFHFINKHRRSKPPPVPPPARADGRTAACGTVVGQEHWGKAVVRGGLEVGQHAAPGRLWCSAGVAMLQPTEVARRLCPAPGGLARGRATTGATQTAQLPTQCWAAAATEENTQYQASEGNPNKSSVWQRGNCV